MIQVENLQFSYTRQPFIENVTFTVGKGEIFGFLGPSGAGKSTLQKILTGFLKSYQGSVLVNNSEVRNISKGFYEHIGIDFEFPSVFERLTAAENLNFFGSLYAGNKIPTTQLLAMVGLERYGNKKVSEYSKGMKSRLNFIKALIHRPDIIFLDEPTSGLDPSNSRNMKQIINNLRSEGRTIILTTHNMHDAAELCDKVAFIIDGRIKALDTPHNFMRSHGGTRITYTYIDGPNGTEHTAEVLSTETSTDSKLQQLIAENRLLSIHSKEPSLEDVFVELTGRRLQ